mgnify:CR=1 FL=1
MQTDPIADFLTSIRNAAAAKHQRVGTGHQHGSIDLPDEKRVHDVVLPAHLAANIRSQTQNALGDLHFNLVIRRNARGDFQADGEVGVTNL